MAGEVSFDIPLWPKRGVSLLPQSLRRAFADQLLPNWLRKDLGLPQGATALHLDSSIWPPDEELPVRVEKFVVSLVAYRLEEIKNLRVMDAQWPQNASPVDVPWPTRLHNALRQHGLLESGRLAIVTYGDLASIPSLGIKTILQFATIADTIAAAAVQPPKLDESIRRELREMAEEEWAERIGANDPRFRDIAPPHVGSIAELFEDVLNNPDDARAASVIDALPRIRARAEQIAAEPLDIALHRLLSDFGISARDVALVSARFGWSGGEVQTLEAVGKQFSVTRERVRQLVGKTARRLTGTYLPQVSAAIQQLSSVAPSTASDAANTLVSSHLTTKALNPRSIKIAGEIFGYDVTFDVERQDGTEYVVSRGDAGSGAILQSARRQAGKVGVSNVAEIHAELESKGHHYSFQAVARILRSSPQIQFLHEEWFWMPDIPAERNRLRNVTRKMLSVTPALDVPTIRQGVRRRYKFMEIDLVPPTEILKAFYLANPEFRVSPDGVVEARDHLDYRSILGEADRVFVEVLSNSPTGLLDRAEFEDAVVARGVNVNTFSVFTTYSPILDHPATSIWCLRGRQIDPAALEALRNVLGTRERKRRLVAYGWTQDGALWLTVLIPSANSPVVYIPVGIKRYVAGRTFTARTREGTVAGLIGINDDGNSWGYGPFLSRRGAEPGDALTAQFDLATSDVILSLGDDAVLTEES